MADILDIISKEQVDRLYSYLEGVDTLTAKVAEYNKTVTSSGEKAKVLADAQREAEKISKEQAATLREIEKERKKVEAAAAKQAAKEKEMADAIAKEAKSIDELNAQNKALLAVRNKVDASTKQGQAEIKKINAQLERNTKEIKQNSNAMEKQRMNIGNYGSALKGVGTKLMGMAAAFGATIGAAEAFKAVMNSTGAAQDWFARTLEGTKEGLNFLARSLATLNFTGLISGFRDAFREGQRYADVLDEIEDRQVALGIQQASIEGAILDQKMILKSNASTIAEKEAAIQEVVRLEKLKLTETQKVNDQALENELQNGAAQIFGAKQVTEERKKLLQDYVSASGEARDQQIAALEQAAALEERLNKLIIVGINDRGQQVRNTTAYDAAIKKLTPEELKLLDLLEISKLLTDEKRDAIGKLSEQQVTNVNEQKQALLTLEKFENQLRNEYIKQEKEEAVIYIKAQKEKQDYTEDLTKSVIKQGQELQEWIHTLSSDHVEMPEPDFPEDVGEKVADPWLTALDDVKAAANEAYNQTTGKQLEALDLQREQLEKYHSLGLVAEEEYQARLQQLDKSTVDLKLQNAQKYTQALADLGQTLLDFNQFLIDTETQRLEQQKQYELSLVGDNVAKKQAIERRYAEEEKKLKIKQAKQDKAQALFSAIIKTAQAVIAGLAFGPPLGYVFAALNAVLGGIQIGLIASQPLPQYAKGTKRARGGLAVVGEKGRELILGPDGSIALSPSTASLVNMGRGGHRIIPNRETEALLRAARGADDPASLRMLNEIKAGNDRLVKAIQDKSEVHISRDGHRITERRGAYARTWYDKKVRI